MALYKLRIAQIDKNKYEGELTRDGKIIDSKPTKYLDEIIDGAITVLKDNGVPVNRLDIGSLEISVLGEERK